MKYTGSCHCQNVRFEIETEIKDVTACNCSICSRKGILMTFVPEQNFKLLSSAGLADYQWGKKTIHHQFCSNCGIQVFGAAKTPDGSPMRAINARCIENIEIEKIPVKHFDGKHKL